MPLNSDNTALQAIHDYYGARTTKRKNIPLIHHILEGIYILDQLAVRDQVKEAYAIHPIIQGDHTVKENLYFFDDYLISSSTLILAMEYRKSANSYLPKPDANGAISSKEDIYVVLADVHYMLIADKVQNYWSLIRNEPVPKGSKRYNELISYFNDWFDYLGVNPDDFIQLY